ncbi:MAG: DUF624 domain-containing protein [Clostridiaceae bacterium]|jgi:uncharacterized membrane protein YesL|nr:DUF624 domain-containing protein [Clostridiaceae bacterium]
MSEDRIFRTAPEEKYYDNKSRASIFFRVLIQKFWKLIEFNLIYLVISIPAIIVSCFIGIYITNSLLPAVEADFFAFLFVYGFPPMVLLMAIPVIAFGPAQAGMAYILRCFSYERPTFYWSDFKDKMKENFKQSLVVSLINLAAFIFLLFDFYLYGQISQNTDNLLFYVANIFLFMILILFIMMAMYIYPMMVSYELKTKYLYKNAFLFSIGRFLPNLVVLFICFLLILAPVLIVVYVGNAMVLAIIYLYYMVLGFSLPGLVSSFFINPVIDKYLKPAPAQANSE